METLLSFLNKDINDKNELKKTAVATRYCCLFNILYFVLFAIISVTDGSVYGAMIALSVALGNLGVMSMTYGKDLQKACIMMDAILFLGVTITVIWFGWDSGIQHFLFALVLYNILFVRMSVSAQMIGALFACLLRLGLYFYCRSFAPRFGFSDSISVFIQVLSTIFVFLQIVACAVYYSIENQNTENTLRKYNRDLEKLAATDPLTQLWNRHRMLEYINEFLTVNPKEFCSVSICDIDYFKRINDLYGHEGGDKILTAIAELFSEEMARQGAVARWGGEEFLIFFQGMNGDEAMAKLIDIKTKLKRMIVPYNGNEIKVTVTFGLVEYDKMYDIDENIRIADDRLYYGKENGRDQIVY